MSLHIELRKKAQTTGVVMRALKPNSRIIAQRMIENGELIKVGNVYKWHEERL